MEHEAPEGVGLGSLPQCMLGCIFKALFMNESMLILRYKQKLFMAETGLICCMFVIICTALLEQKCFDLIYRCRLHSITFGYYYSVVLTFESVGEILWCNHSNETSSAVLSQCTICFSTFYKMKWERFVKFWVLPLFAVRKLRVSWSYMPEDVFCHFWLGLFSILALPFGVTTETLATQDPEAEDEETETPIFEKHDAMLHGQRKDRK